MHFAKLVAFGGFAVAGVHAAPGGHHPPPPPPPPPSHVTTTTNTQSIHCGSQNEPYCCEGSWPYQAASCVAINAGSICSSNVVCCNSNNGGIDVCLTQVNQGEDGSIYIDINA